MQEIIQQALENEGVKIIEGEMYEIKNPFYEHLMNSTPIRNKAQLFPIEMARRTKKIIKLPFNIIVAIGKETSEVINEVIK